MSDTTHHAYLTSVWLLIIDVCSAFLRMFTWRNLVQAHRSSLGWTLVERKAAFLYFLRNRWNVGNRNKRLKASPTHLFPGDPPPCMNSVQAIPNTWSDPVRWYDRPRTYQLLGCCTDLKKYQNIWNILRKIISCREDCVCELFAIRAKNESRSFWLILIQISSRTRYILESLDWKITTKTNQEGKKSDSNIIWIQVMILMTSLRRNVRGLKVMTILWCFNKNIAAATEKRAVVGNYCSNLTCFVVCSWSLPNARSMDWTLKDSLKMWKLWNVGMKTPGGWHHRYKLGFLRHKLWRATAKWRLLDKQCANQKFWDWLHCGKRQLDHTQCLVYAASLVFWLFSSLRMTEARMMALLLRNSVTALYLLQHFCKAEKLGSRQNVAAKNFCLATATKIYFVTRGNARMKSYISCFVSFRGMKMKWNDVHCIHPLSVILPKRIQISRDSASSMQ